MRLILIEQEWHSTLYGLTIVLTKSVYGSEKGEINYNSKWQV